MRQLFILLTTLLLSTTAMAQPKQTPTMFAHRGCWSKNEAKQFVVPENSLPAVAMAKRMGYKGIECDVHYTKDKRMVILHDATINRTMRRAADYSKIENPTRLADLTFEELRRDYVLESDNPAWRTPIPTAEELLSECKKHGIMPMLHSSLEESYHLAQEMFGDEWICFTSDVEQLFKVREFSDCIVLMSISNGTPEQHIPTLEKIGGRCGISSMSYKLYTPEFCEAFTSRGYIVQASIFPTPHEAIAQRNGISYQLSDYSIMPSKKPIGTVKYKTSAEAQEGYKLPLSNYALECGALTLEIEYCGEVELLVNGRKYTLKSETMQKDIIGSRFFNSSPVVEITHPTGTKIKRAVASIYKY